MSEEIILTPCNWAAGCSLIRAAATLAADAFHTRPDLISSIQLARHVPELKAILIKARDEISIALKHLERNE